MAYSGLEEAEEEGAWSGVSMRRIPLVGFFLFPFLIRVPALGQIPTRVDDGPVLTKITGGSFSSRTETTPIMHPSIWSMLGKKSPQRIGMHVYSSPWCCRM